MIYRDHSRNIRMYSLKQKSKRLDYRQYYSIVDEEEVYRVIGGYLPVTDHR